jgi:hypothetical protein
MGSAGFAFKGRVIVVDRKMNGTEIQSTKMKLTLATID